MDYVCLRFIYRHIHGIHHVPNVLENHQSGAMEACWAHNPEVRGSKPRSAKCFRQLCKNNWHVYVEAERPYLAPK